MARPNLRTHRKFKRLVAMLGMPEPHVRGHLEYLWEAAYENGEEFIGDSVDVELAASWTGESGQLTDALTTCGGEGRIGFIENIDGDYFIHDLWDHAPEYVQKRRQREIERQKTGAELSKNTPRGGQRRTMPAEWRTTADEQQTAADCGAPPAPAPAPAHAHAHNKARTAEAEAPAEFEMFWETYPRHIDKKRALKAWKARIKDGYSPEAIHTAAKNYAAHCRANKTEEKFVKHPATFVGPDLPFLDWQKQIAIPEEDIEEEPDNGLDEWRISCMSPEQRKQYDRVMTQKQKELYDLTHPDEVRRRQANANAA